MHGLFIKDEIVTSFTRLEFTPSVFRLLRPRLITFENGTQRIGAECTVLRQRQRPIGAAPGRQFDRPLIDQTVLTVSNRQENGCADWQEPNACWRVLTKDGFEAHFLA